MEEPRYDQEFEYEEYQEAGLTNIGLPASQLALIIGVNAVISLVISIAVVLVANRQVLPGDIATSAFQSPVTAAAAVAQTETLAAASASAQAELVPASTPLQAVTYVVEAGDTLGLIAQKFSVSISDLMIANGLTNQDFIQVGQELTIPLGGVSTATPTFPTSPSTSG